MSKKKRGSVVYVINRVRLGMSGQCISGPCTLYFVPQLKATPKGAVALAA